MTDELLVIALSAAVPLHSMGYQERGGPTPEDWARAKAFGPILGEQADRLLFRSKKQGETASLFNRLADAIAILSYVPGGVTMFGTHWETVPA